MADYKSMYFQIFNKVSELIHELQTVQLQTEAMYMHSDQSDSFSSEELTQTKTGEIEVS